MAKTWGSLSILVAALIASLLIFQSAYTASASSVSSDPVPGGMCGCMSCNCYMVDAQAEPSSYVPLISQTDASQDWLITPASLTAAAAHSAGGDTSETSSHTTTSSSGHSTNSQSSNSSNSQSIDSHPANTSSASGSSGSSGSSNSSSNSNSDSSKSGFSNNGKKKEPANPNTTTNTQTVETHPANPAPAPVKATPTPPKPAPTTPAKNSSGSPDDRNTTSATGQSSGSYPYTSTAGQAKTGSTDSRDSFLETLNLWNSNLTAPQTNGSSFQNTLTLPLTSSPTLQQIEAQTFNRLGAIYYTDAQWRIFSKNGTASAPSNNVVRIVTTNSATQAIQEAQLNTNDIGAYYEYPNSSGKIQFVNDKGVSVPDPTKK